MKINFNKEDLKKFNKLVETKEINMAVASMFMDYNTYIDVVDEKEMKRSKNEVETYLNTFLDNLANLSVSKPLPHVASIT